MRNDDLDIEIHNSFRDDKGLVPKYLARDIVNYNFNSQDWRIDMSKATDHYNELVLSEIGIVNHKTGEIFGGWSDYVATADGKELYIFWDTIDYFEKKLKNME